MVKNFWAGYTEIFRSAFEKMHPTRAIALSFLFVIASGTGLLMLPISAVGESASFTTALFTATSAVCVTGLVVVDTFSYWTFFGKAVILGLIQVGGLGLITLMMVLVVISGRKITLKDRVVMQASLNQDNFSGLLRLMKVVVQGTFLVEGIAAVILTIRFYQDPGATLWIAVKRGVFHAISAFCNAGFDILGSRSLMDYVGDPTVNLTIMSLIVFGGLGFSVWSDVINHVRHPSKKHKYSPKALYGSLSLHSKIAILMTTCLITGGALIFFLAEHNNPGTMGGLTLGEKIWASFFQSVTLRTAGFFSIPQGAMDQASKFLSVLLMTAGGSPGGTAGGIKTVTIGIVIVTVVSMLRGRESSSVFGRKIGVDAVLKSLTVIAAFLFFVGTATVLLAFSERGAGYAYDFMDLWFEITSATATVGVTTGITPNLTTIGRLIVVSSMYLGRIGPVTLLMALNIRLNKNKDHLEYPEEKVLIG